MGGVGVDGLIGGEDRDPGGAEFFFQPQRVVHVPAGPFDVLADRRRERRLPGRDGARRSAIPAVTGNPGRRILPDIRAGAAVQVDPARFHIPVVAGDQNPSGSRSRASRSCLASDSTGPARWRCWSGRGTRPLPASSGAGVRVPGIAVLPYPPQILLYRLGLPGVDHACFFPVSILTLIRTFIPPGLSPSLRL